MQGRHGLYYGEYLDFAPGVGRDEVGSFFAERRDRHDDLTYRRLTQGTAEH